jgi:hypothetical protein
MGKEKLTCRKYSVSDIAVLYGVSRDLVLNWITSGELPSVNVAQFRAKRSRYLVGDDDLAVFEERRRVVGPLSPPEALPRRRGRKPTGIKEYF